MELFELLDEEALVSTKSSMLNRLFRESIKEIFTPLYLKKIDRVFGTIQIKEVKKHNNIMAYTIPGKNIIYINANRIYALEPKKAVVYVLHEFIHLVQNSPSFREVKEVNNELCEYCLKHLRRTQIPKFLTGKTQNIHSNQKNEFLTYLMNGSVLLDMLGKDKEGYLEILSNSGLFDLNSQFWKTRLN